MSLIFTRYFEDDEEESSTSADLPYIPAENSPTRQQMQSGGGSDSEDDPLDAFMAEVEVRKLEFGIYFQVIHQLFSITFIYFSEPSS